MILKSSRAFFVVLFLWGAAKLPAQENEQKVWGPNIKFRDQTKHFLGSAAHPKPAEGWWVTPIHASLLPDGKVLLTGWGRIDEQSCRVHNTRQNGESFLLDPDTVAEGHDRTRHIFPLDEQPRPLTQDVLYCSGMSHLSDGNVLYISGARYYNLGDKPDLEPGTAPEDEYGLNYLRVFNPRTRRFRRYEFAPKGGPQRPGGTRFESGMMWYPTLTRLPGNKLLVTGGFDRNCADGSCYNRDLEIFDPALLEKNLDPWSVWLAHDQVPSNTYEPGIKDYTHSFLLYKPIPAEKGGGRERQVLLMGWPGHFSMLSLKVEAGEDVRARLYPRSDVDASADQNEGPDQQQELWASLSRPGGAAAWDSSAALVGTGEILIVGGGANAQAEAQRIDLYNPQTGTWRSKDTGITRHNPVATLLPDGKVLIVNGEPGDDPHVLGSRKQPQIYDPFTDELTTLPAWNDPNPLDRGYHSFSLLLKDGRILIGGGMVGLGQVGCERPDLRLLNLPYLHGARPRLLEDEKHGRVPLRVTIGHKFYLHVAGARLREERGVALMALGSETHSFDQNQRYVPLKIRRMRGGYYAVEAPANNTIAPEGEYLLFLVSDHGVVSKGKNVNLKSVPLMDQ